MLFPGIMRLVFPCAILLLTTMPLCADPAGSVSSSRHEGVIVTSLAQPEFFIFQSGTREEHFDGTTESMQAQGGLDQGEPITGLHYLRPQLTVNGPPWSPDDAQLIATQFHGAATGNFYLFKTIDGQLFFLPKQGETPVVRVDFRLKDGRTVTVWTRK
jgi:hypothetical protein